MWTCNWQQYNNTWQWYSHLFWPVSSYIMQPRTNHLHNELRLLCFVSFWHSLLPMHKHHGWTAYDLLLLFTCFQLSNQVLHAVMLSGWAKKACQCAVFSNSIATSEQTGQIKMIVKIETVLLVVLMELESLFRLYFQGSLVHSECGQEVHGITAARRGAIHY